MSAQAANDKARADALIATCLVPGGAPTFHRGLSALLEVDAP